MKTLLVLLLLIPSLSVAGKELALSCEHESSSLGTMTEIFIFDLDKRHVTKIFEFENIVTNPYPIIEITNSLIKFEDIGLVAEGIGSLNRYNLDLVIKERVREDGEKLINLYYQCAIIKKQF